MRHRTAAAACSLLAFALLSPLAFGQPKALTALKDKDFRDVVDVYLNQAQYKSALNRDYGKDGLTILAANIDYSATPVPTLTWYVPPKQTLAPARAIVVKTELQTLLKQFVTYSAEQNPIGLLSAADANTVTITVELRERTPGNESKPTTTATTVAWAGPCWCGGYPNAMGYAGYVYPAPYLYSYWAAYPYWYYYPYPYSYWTPYSYWYPYTYWYPGWAPYPYLYPAPYAYPYPYTVAAAGANGQPGAAQSPSPTAVAGAGGIGATERVPFAPADAAAVEELTRGKTASDALALYDRGYRLLWQEKPAEALVHLTAAIRLNDADARFWYYRWLAERALGSEAEAEASLKTAVRLDAAASAKEQADIRTALEPVQGPIRGVLDKAKTQR